MSKKAEKTKRKLPPVHELVDEYGGPHWGGVIQVYREENGDWRWRAVCNGRIVACSGEGYRRRGDMARGLCAAKEVLLNLVWQVMTVEN